MSLKPEVLYVHDLVFKIKDSKRYSSTGMPEKYFDRFFDAGFGSVNILSRVSSYNHSEDTGYSIIEKRRVKLSKVNISNYISMFSIRYIRSVIQEIKRADILVTNVPSITGIFVLIINLFVKKPFSLEVAADYDQFSTKKGGVFVSIIMKPLLKFFSKKAVSAIYVSNYLRQKYPCKGVSLVSSNVNISVDKNNRKSPRNAPFRKKDKINIGFVGAINSRKGIHAILDCAIYLKKSGYDNFIFHLVGGHFDGDWRAESRERKLGQNITFHGLNTTEKVRGFYSFFDLYVQPSITEGIPRATIEAMSYGLPVIATELPGFKEVLPSNALIASSDGFLLANKIIEVISSSELYNNYSLHNFEKSVNFDYAVLHKRRVGFYKRLFDVI